MPTLAVVKNLDVFPNSRFSLCPSLEALAAPVVADMRRLWAFLGVELRIPLNVPQPRGDVQIWNQAVATGL